MEMTAGVVSACVWGTERRGKTQIMFKQEYSMKKLAGVRAGGQTKNTWKVCKSIIRKTGALDNIMDLAVSGDRQS